MIDGFRVCKSNSNHKIFHNPYSMYCKGDVIPISRLIIIRFSFFFIHIESQALQELVDTDRLTVAPDFCLFPRIRIHGCVFHRVRPHDHAAVSLVLPTAQV